MSDQSPSLDPRARDLGLSVDEFATVVGQCWRFVNSKDCIDDILQIALMGIAIAYKDFTYYGTIDEALRGTKKPILSRKSFLNRVVVYTLINEIQTTSCDFLYSAVPHSQRKMPVGKACFAFGSPESTTGMMGSEGESITSDYVPGDDFRRTDDEQYVETLICNLPPSDLDLVRCVLQGESRADYARRHGLVVSNVYAQWAVIKSTLASGILKHDQIFH
jgi:hypothetical protein